MFDDDRNVYRGQCSWPVSGHNRIHNRIHTGMDTASGHNHIHIGMDTASDHNRIHTGMDTASDRNRIHMMRVTGLTRVYLFCNESRHQE